MIGHNGAEKPREGVRVDTCDVMREMAYRAGKSLRGASEEMGRSPTWLGTTVGRGSDSGAGTVAALGRVCGYDLAAVPTGRELPEGSMVIDPRG